MENSPVLDSNNKETSFKAEKPKGRLNKKILIICSLISIIIIAVAAYFIISTRYSRMIETYINAELSSIELTYGDDFNYNPFKCSGFKEIECSSDYIEFYELDQKFLVKNISFKAAPFLKELNISSTGSIEISSVDAEKNPVSNDIITLNFNCTDNMTLLSERSLLAHNLMCDSNLNNIHSNQQSVFYMKDDVYSESSSIIGVLKAVAEQNIDFRDQLMNFTVVESSVSKIESPALMDDIVAVMQLLVKSYTDETIHKENIAEIYTELKNDYIKFKDFYGYNKYTNFMDNLINAVDGVIYNNHNTISMSMILQNKDIIDSMFDSEYMKFMLPDYYDISIESSK